MSNATLQNVFEARRRAQEELRSLYDAADGRELDGEEKQTEERLASAIADYENREANLIAMDEERSAAVSAHEMNPAAGAQAPAVKADHRGDLRRLARGEVRSVDVGYEARALTSDTATDGAELVATEVFNEITELATAASPMLRLSRILTTAGGNPIVLPRVTTNPAATLEGQGDAIAESELQTGTVTLGAYGLKFLTEVANELEQDAAFPVDQFLIEEGGKALGRGMDYYAAIGTGSDQPQGVVTGATVGKTVASATAVTVEELIDLQYSVIQPYRADASWIFGDSTVAAVRKLKGSDGHFLWTPSGIAGQPDTLLGNPVETDPNISAMGAGNVFGVFGDLRSAFFIRIAGGYRIDKSPDAGFENDTTKYRFVVRMDSDIVAPAAVRSIKSAAS